MHSTVNLCLIHDTFILSVKRWQVSAWHFDIYHIKRFLGALKTLKSDSNETILQSISYSNTNITFLIGCFVVFFTTVMHARASSEDRL